MTTQSGNIGLRAQKIVDADIGADADEYRWCIGVKPMVGAAVPSLVSITDFRVWVSRNCTDTHCCGSADCNWLLLLQVVAGHRRAALSLRSMWGAQRYEAAEERRTQNADH